MKPKCLAIANCIHTELISNNLSENIESEVYCKYSHNKYLYRLAK